jgi:hypothetical protein
LRAKTVDLAGTLDISEQLKGKKNAPDGGAGKAGGVGDFDDAAALVMTLETLDDAKAAGEGEHEVGVARVGGELLGFARGGWVGRGFRAPDRHGRLSHSLYKIARWGIISFIPQ